MKEPLAPGVRIRDTYEIVRQMNATELVTSYLTRASNNVYYVLRDLHPPVEGRQTERVAAQVLREAQALGRLQFQGLPVIVDAFGWDGRAFIAREYSNEPTLVEVLENMRGLAPENQVRGWFGQLLDIFGYLHAQQPPHLFRGLSPEMIGLSKMGRIHIQDYPDAFFLPAEMQYKYARRTAPGYVSPEQERGEPLTPASDVYNLGQVFYYMLTRKDPSIYPYSRNAMAIARPDATGVLLALLDSATAKNPNDRFKNVTDLQQHLLGGMGKTKSSKDIGFTLDTREIVLENVKRGDIIRRKFIITSKSGREIYGKVRTDHDWIRFKFDVFRGSTVTLDFSINSYDFVNGETYRAVIQLDTDAGVDEVDVVVSTPKTIGSMLSKGFKSIFGKPKPEETPEAPGEADF
ncbi:MAG: hypothetical protein EB084_03695 [Proteobacteria bacterium]|nr:hypothetical protein [Pseudomonadota bacterium]